MFAQGIFQGSFLYLVVCRQRVLRPEVLLCISAGRFGGLLPKSVPCLREQVRLWRGAGSSSCPVLRQAVLR